MITFSIIRGPSAGRTFTVESEQITIGRSPLSDIALDDESASGRHAEVAKQGERYVLTDLKSTNGTWVNGRLVKKIPLYTGDEIQVGQTLLRYTDGTPPREMASKVINLVGDGVPGPMIHATVESPQRFNVVVPPPNNIFEVAAVTKEVPAPSHEQLCVCYGWLGYPNLQTRRSVIHLSTLEDPVQTPVGEAGGQMPITSDADGYLEFELIRGGLYSVIVPGYEDEPIIVRIPDADTARVKDLLFPVPRLLTFDPSGPLAMAVGDTEELDHTTLTLSSGFVLDAGALDDNDTLISRYIEYESDDEDVAIVTSASDGTPVITAIGAGACLITGTIVEDSHPRRLPEPSLTMSPVAGVSVTVV